MGLFFYSEPDHFPNERPVGFKRYAQVLERDWKRLFLVDLLTLGSLIPFGFGLGYAVLSSSILVLMRRSSALVCAKSSVPVTHREISL